MLTHGNAIKVLLALLLVVFFNFWPFLSILPIFDKIWNFWRFLPIWLPFLFFSIKNSQRFHKYCKHTGQIGCFFSSKHSLTDRSSTVMLCFQFRVQFAKMCRPHFKLFQLEIGFALGLAYERFN